DGIRDFHVTGVQTCALPISPETRIGDAVIARGLQRARRAAGRRDRDPAEHDRAGYPARRRMIRITVATGEEGRVDKALAKHFPRSEERRVGKEGGAQW